MHCGHNHYQILNKATLVSIKSNTYFIFSQCTDVEDMENTLDVYTLNGLQFQCMQRITVNSLSTLDGRWETKDFHVIPTLF